MYVAWANNIKIRVSHNHKRECLRVWHDGLNLFYLTVIPPTRFHVCDCEIAIKPVTYLELPTKIPPEGCYLKVVHIRWRRSFRHVGSCHMTEYFSARVISAFESCIIYGVPVCTSICPKWTALISNLCCLGGWSVRQPQDIKEITQ
jgi:hypothetical protein